MLTKQTIEELRDLYHKMQDPKYAIPDMEIVGFADSMNVYFDTILSAAEWALENGYAQKYRGCGITHPFGSECR